MKNLLLFISFLLAITYSYAQAGDICFVHTATAGNISTNVSYIDHPALNNNPTAKFIVTHSLAGDGSVTYNDIPTGIFYSSTQDKWYVYNEDATPMLESSSYNIYIPGTGASMLSAVSTGGQWYFVVDNAITNDKPDLLPVITHVWSGAYMDYNYGVYYPATNKWGIYSEDQSSEIPSGETFNMLVAPSNVGYNTNHSFIHIANTGNQSSGNGSFVDHPLLNNNPNANFVITHKWGEGSDYTFTNYYNIAEGKWEVVKEVSSPLNSGEAFHIVYTLPAPPNNMCVDATPLAVGINFGDYDVVGTLLGSDGDSFGGVWYKVTVPVTGDITIETDQASGSTMHDTWMAVYSGTCGSPVFITADDNNGNGNFAKISLTGRTPGETLLIKIEEDAQSADPTGSFRIAAYDVSLNIADAIVDGFEMYPNPVENILNLSALNAIENVSIYNMLGQEVLQTTPATTQVEVDMSTLSTGSYIVKVQAGEQIGSYNLIKQ